ncbi:MAG: AAA family ATPase [Candidatus Krumholzibacteria bacterium]|nr:AAA family ATPase [Candidatus Krumholzibacteria bacterium]
MTTGNNNHSLRLINIDSDRHARDYIKRSLTDKGIRVIGEADDLKGGLRLIRGLQPEVVVLELPASASETIEAVRKIREELPATGIILSAHDPSSQLILSCMRAGVQEFVGRPVDAPQLEKAVEHVRRIQERMINTRSRRGTVVSVFSSKGGVGATSVVANLGVALADRFDARTVLVDLSFQMGDLALMLNHPPKYSLTDALHDGVIEESKLRSVLTEHHSGVHLLTVAASPEIGEEITRQHMVELFGTLNTMFDYIIVDVGRHLDDRTVEVLELSDRILMMTSLDVPTIRNVSRYLNIFEQLELDRDKIHMIVNRFHKKSRLSLKDIEMALGMETFWTIPNDFEPMSLGIDQGNPAVKEAPRSKVAQSFKDLVESFAAVDGDQSSSAVVEEPST